MKTLYLNVEGIINGVPSFSDIIQAILVGVSDSVLYK